MPNLLQIKYPRLGETTCGRIPQSITEEVKKEAEQRINSRFIIHNEALLKGGRRYGNSAESLKLKKARDYLGSAKK